MCIRDRNLGPHNKGTSSIILTPDFVAFKLFVTSQVLSTQCSRWELLMILSARVHLLHLTVTVTAAHGFAVILQLCVVLVIGYQQSLWSLEFVWWSLASVCCLNWQEVIVQTQFTTLQTTRFWQLGSWYWWMLAVNAMAIQAILHAPGQSLVEEIFYASLFAYLCIRHCCQY